MKNNIGEMIKESRERAGISIRELGRLTGISSAHLSRIERNIQYPSCKMLRNITRYIDLNYNELMKQQGLGMNIGLDNPYIYDYYSNLKGNQLRQALNWIDKIRVERRRLLNFLYEWNVTLEETNPLLLDTIKDVEYLRNIEEEILHLLERQALKEYRNMS